MSIFIYEFYLFLTILFHLCLASQQPAFDLVAYLLLAFISAFYRYISLLSAFGVRFIFSMMKTAFDVFGNLLFPIELLWCCQYIYTYFDSMHLLISCFNNSQRLDWPSYIRPPLVEVVGQRVGRTM